MARKKSQEESIGEVLFDLFVDTAWWVPFPAAPILAGVALLLWYLLTVKLAHAAWDWNMARWIAIVAGAAVLLIGFAAQFKKSSRRKMVRDNQTLDSSNKLSWREFERLVPAATHRRVTPPRSSAAHRQMAARTFAWQVIARRS